jgi:hypothetical protein
MEEILEHTIGLMELGVPIIDGLTHAEEIEMRKSISNEIPFGVSIDGMEYGDVEGCTVGGFKVQSVKMLKWLKDFKRSAQKSITSANNKIRITHEQYPVGHEYHDPNIEETSGVHSVDSIIVTSFNHGGDTDEVNSRYYRF